MKGNIGSVLSISFVNIVKNPESSLISLQIMDSPRQVVVNCQLDNT